MNFTRSKLRVLVDMDGVLADFMKGCKTLGVEPDEAELLPGFYESLPIIEGASQAIVALCESEYDLHICSTAPWNNPSAWMEKRVWIEKHFGERFKKKLILTHRKDLVDADVLIDDRRGSSTINFKGHWIWFGQNGMTWPQVVEELSKLKKLK